jgi:drug/metabolite transporter (DMT)-like permease
MLYVVLYTILFSIVTVASILLTGSRSFINGSNLTPMAIVKMISDWHFILGAGFAFAARLFFIMINNSLLKIPDLANSSTTITMFITSIAMVFVIIANYYFLGEKINLTQGVGAFVIIIGIFMITR